MTIRKTPALAVFDVCDTLYATNTTRAFLDLLAPSHARIAKTLKRWTSRRSPWFYIGAVAHRFLGHDIARRALIRSLAGISRAELEATGKELAADHLPSVANGELHDRLRRHLEAGDEAILISNSLDAVIAPIAATLGVRFRASELEFRNGVSTGRLASELTGRKASVLDEISGDRQRLLWVYTDNRSDADLLALADKRVIVLPRGCREWGKVGSEYIRL